MGEHTGKKNVISSNNISSEAISVIDKRFHVKYKAESCVFRTTGQGW